ncbi:MAG: aminoacyl-tRNA deacylase [Candidatus Kariarchaeaceae archaeon]
MESPFETLLNFCKTNKTEIDRMEYDEPVRSVLEAVEVSGYPKSKFIKTVLLRHKSEGNYVIAIIIGGTKVDKKALQEGVNPKRWRMADPDEVLEVTGFPVGGVPPICLSHSLEYTTKIYVDPRVLQRDFVIGGGGTQNSLLKLDPKFIVIQGAEVKVVSFG